MAKKSRTKFIVKRSSAGLGLFANRHFDKEDFLIEYKGPILSDEASDQKGGKYLFKICKGKTIDGSPRSNLARYINHSHRPNCEPINEDDERIVIHALRDIEPGEELTYNYGKEYVDEFCNPCLCAYCQNKKKQKNKK